MQCHCWSLTLLASKRLRSLEVLKFKILVQVGSDEDTEQSACDQVYCHRLPEPKATGRTATGTLCSSIQSVNGKLMKVNLRTCRLWMKRCYVCLDTVNRHSVCWAGGDLGIFKKLFECRIAEEVSVMPLLSTVPTSNASSPVQNGSNVWGCSQTRHTTWKFASIAGTGQQCSQSESRI